MNLTKEDIDYVRLKGRLPFSFRLIFDFVLGNSILLVMPVLDLYYYFFEGKDKGIFMSIVSLMSFLLFVFLFYRFYLATRTYFLAKVNKEYDINNLISQVSESLDWNIHNKTTSFFEIFIPIRNDRATNYLYVFVGREDIKIVCFSYGPFLTAHIKEIELRELFESRFKRLFSIKIERYFKEIETLPVFPDIEGLKDKSVNILMQILRVHDIDVGFTPYSIEGRIVEFKSVKDTYELELHISLLQKFNGKTINLKKFRNVSYLRVIVYPKYINNFLKGEGVFSAVSYYKKDLGSTKKRIDVDRYGKRRNDDILITYDAKIQLV